MNKWFQYVASSVWFQSQEGNAFVCLLLLYQPLLAQQIRLEKPASFGRGCSWFDSTFRLFVLSTGEGRPLGKSSCLVAVEYS